MRETKGWMRPHELDRRRDRESFDPVLEGSSYGLSRELALTIWERVCAKATDRGGRRDLEQAKRRFHEIAARIAARGGRLGAEIGKQTRVAAESGGGASRLRNVDELATPTPGRQTLVAVEARRWAPVVDEALDGLLDEPIDEAVNGPLEVIDGGASNASTRDESGASRERRLPVATLDRMARAFGQRFDDVEIHLDSAQVPTGIEASTRGRHIFFVQGAFDPDSEHREHVIAHELAHVAQQSRPMGLGRDAVPTRAALEADAHQAALNVLAGRAASVNLFAPAAAALGFSSGGSPPATSARGPAQSTRSGSPGRSSGTSASSRAPSSASAGPGIPQTNPGSDGKAGQPRPVSATSSTAVSAIPGRGATGDRLHVPEAPATLTPAAADRLRTIQTGNQGNAGATTTLPTGQQQTDVGRAAFEEPQVEQDARALHGVVTEVDDRPPPSPEIEQACARIRQAIRDKRPPDEDKLATLQPSRFDDFLALGLQQMLRVALAHGGQTLVEATLGTPAPDPAHAAPFPPTASRHRGATGGHAMWRAGERYGASLYRRAVDSGDVEHDSPMVDAAMQRCGTGEPLPDALRRTMEAQLGVPLDRVRIHTDRVAADAARAMHAEAFTVGEDIFFAAGAFASGTPDGQRLLAHELTHVIQAWQGRTGAGGRVSQPGEPLEREADAVAERVGHNDQSHGQGRGTARADLAGDEAVVPRPVPVQAPEGQPVLRRAAAGSAPGRRATMPALKGGAKRSTGQRAQQTMQGTSDEFKRHAGRAATQATGKLTHEIAAAKTAAPGKRAHDHVKAERRAAQADEHAMRSAEKLHHDHAHTLASHKPEAAEHPVARPATAPADARSVVKFKPVSSWAKYMPEPLPDQDERERKRIEKLVKAKIEGERNQAAQTLDGLRTAHMQQARDVRAMKPKLQAQVATAQQQALGHVAASESSQSAAVRSHIASLQSQVRGHAGAMRGQVTSAHAAAIAKINETYDTAVQKTTDQRTKTESDVNASETLAQLILQFDFLALQTKYSALGSAKAGDALKTGEDQAAGMSGRWDGEKLEAAQKAARDTADGFATSMPEQTAQKWAEISAEQPAAAQGLHDYATGTKTNLGLVFDQAKQALDAVKSQSIQAADAAKTASLAQIDQACSSTVASLGAQGASQVAAIHQNSQAARAGITSAGTMARRSVAQACDQAATGIEGGVVGLIRGAQQVEAPDPDEIHQQATKGAQDLQQGAGGVVKGLTASATSAADSLNQQASGASDGMAAITTALRASANQAAAAAKQHMSAAAKGASQGLGQLATSHKTTTDLSVDSSQKAFTEQVTQLDKQYTATAEKRGTVFKDGYDQFASGLHQTVPDWGGGRGGAGSGNKEDGGGDSGGATREEIPAIQEAAQKAADAVKPWWQEALAVVVSIVVAVVVVIVVTALIAATGPVGMILVGALAGALSTFAASVASNLVLGNSPLDGITWQSIAIGALGGAISGGITAGLGAAAKAGVSGAARAVQGADAASGALKGAAGVRAAAIRQGTEFATDFVSEQAANLIINHKLDISVENLVLSAVANAATGGAKFEGFQTKVQGGIQKVIPGGVKVPGLQVQIGVPRPPAGAGVDPVGGHEGGPAARPAAGGPHGGAPPGGVHATPPARSGSPASNSAAAPLPAPAASPTPRPTVDTGGPPARPSGGSDGARPGDGGSPSARPGDRGQPSPRPADTGSPPARPAGDADGVAPRPADTNPPARPDGDGGTTTPAHGDADPAGTPHPDAPGSHPDGSDGATGKPHPDADGRKPDAADPKAHPDGPKPDAADPKAHPDADGGKPGAGDPKAPAGADGGKPGPAGDGAAPDADAAAAEAKAAVHDAELGELGYAEGTRAKGDELAAQIEQGSTPNKDVVRDTEANARGRGGLEKLLNDPTLTPEARAKLRQQLADQLRAKPEPTGNLERDLHDTKAKIASEPKPGGNTTDVTSAGGKDSGAPKPDGDAIALVGDGDALAAAAKRVPPAPGKIDVVVHGDGKTFIVKHNGREIELDHRALATFIRKNGGGDQEIRLISCSSGESPHAIAQDLANKLGTSVTAPNDTLWIHPDGSLSVGKAADANTGGWNEFTPGTRMQPVDAPVAHPGAGQGPVREPGVDAPGTHPGADGGPAREPGPPHAEDQPVAAAPKKGNEAAKDAQYPMGFEIEGKHYNVETDGTYHYYSDGKGGFDLRRSPGNDTDPTLRVEGTPPNVKIIVDPGPAADTPFPDPGPRAAFDLLAGPDSKSSFRDYFKVLEDHGIAKREDIEQLLAEQLTPDVKIGTVRHSLKEHFKDDIFDLTLRENGEEVDQARSRDLMEDIASRLHGKDRFNLHERWVGHWNLPPSAIAQSPVPKRGDMVKDRQVDYHEIEDGVLTEVKSHSGKLSANDKAQFEDYMEAVRNGHGVTDADGNTLPVHEIVYAFTKESGARANEAWIRQALEENPNLTVHIHGDDGTQHSFKAEDGPEIDRFFDSPPQKAANETEAAAADPGSQGPRGSDEAPIGPVSAGRDPTPAPDEPTGPVAAGRGSRDEQPADKEQATAAKRASNLAKLDELAARTPELTAALDRLPNARETLLDLPESLAAPEKALGTLKDLEKLEALTAKNPVLKTTLDSVPKAQKSLLEHPEALDVLEQALGIIEARGSAAVVKDAMLGQTTPISDEQRALGRDIAEGTPGAKVVGDKVEQVKPTQQPEFDLARKNDPAYLDEYLDILYEQAQIAQAELDVLTAQIAGDTGTAGSRPEPKDRDRSKEKIAADYNGDASKIIDLAGAKIVYKSLDELYAGLAALPQDKIVYIKDRFIKPADSGYRDILLNVKMSNGHIAELRLHLESIDKSAGAEHATYEIRRSIDAGAAARPLGQRHYTPEEGAIIKALNQVTNPMFQEALKEAL